MEILGIIPAYNEEQTIRKTIKLLTKYIDQIVVVNDGSTDKTADILGIFSKKMSLKIISHTKNLGQGRALISGFRYAIRIKARAVVTFDADGQHDPSFIPIFKKCFENGYDYVVGSRFLKSNSNMQLYRKYGIKFFSILTSIFMRKRITDITSGYRLISVSLLRRFKLKQAQYSSPELYIQAINSGYNIIEIPITMKSRQYSGSKKGRLFYALGLLRSIIISFLYSS